MRIMLILILLLSIIVNIKFVQCLSDWRIVGGQTAAPGQFPYQVSLRRKGQHTCGGAILNKYWILTAAHCIVGVPGSLTIQVGSNELHFGGPPYLASQTIYHPNYDSNLIKNDIALIKTTTPIQFNNRTQPIPLNNIEITPGQLLTLSGWGRLGIPGEIPEFLQYIQLKSISTEECQERLKNIVDTQLCTFTKSGEGACRGDSGGPLVYNGKVSGIVSWGKPCAVGYPDVFTKVSKYIGWIENIITTM